MNIAIRMFPVAKLVLFAIQLASNISTSMRRAQIFLKTAAKTMPSTKNSSGREPFEFEARTNIVRERASRTQRLPKQILTKPKLS